MSLPKLSTALYTLTLPVSKQKITFRPFMVKEEKAILVSRKTSSNPVDQIKTLIQVIEDCVIEPKGFNAGEISYVDYRYLVLKLRNQSKGSDLSGKLKCKHCKTEQVVTYDFDDVIRITNTEPENLPKTVLLQAPSIGFIPKMPTVLDVISIIEELGIKTAENFETRIQDDPDAGFRFMATCIKAFYDDETVTDVTVDETLAYINDQFSEEHLEVVANYIRNMPRMTIDLSFECKNCGETSEILVEGDSDFFR